MVLYAFYAAWDEAVKSTAAPDEGSYRQMVEEENKQKAKAAYNEQNLLKAFVKEFVTDGVDERSGVNDEALAMMQSIIDKAKAVAVEDEKKAHDDHEHHGDEKEPMSFLTMPKVVQRHGEAQPEVHIGWADIYLDLILVGVAFNGGTLLKHAFYLCVPPGDSSSSTADSADASDSSGSLAASHHRVLSSSTYHPQCVGLWIGVLHILAFGVPILGAWLKETMFRARFKAHNLLARGLEVMCYLLMIIGASCEEDVQVLQADRTFWKMITRCMLAIDITWVARYMQIAGWHPEECARRLAKQRLLLLLPGTLLYSFAMFLGNWPDEGDVSLQWLLGEHLHHTSHSHLFYVPMLLILGANTPLFFEVFLFAMSSYRPALPANVVFMLHRCTEIFMVLLGESVLQLITSEMPAGEPGMTSEEELKLQQKFLEMQIAGFILTLTVMHSFTIQEPSHHEHVLNTAGPKAMLWLIFFLLKSISVWLVGIGIKIALYNPIAAKDAFFSHEQRLLLGSASALCYLFSGFMLPLHGKTICDHYTHVFSNPVTALGFFLWIANLMMMYNITWWVLPPYEYIWAQTALGILHMIVTHLELIWIPALMKAHKDKYLARRKSHRSQSSKAMLA